MALSWDNALLTKSEQQVCAFIRNYPRIVTNMSLKELSKACYISQASIIRLCKKLQCKGFADFKIKLATELSTVTSNQPPVSQNVPIAPNDSTEDIMTAFFNLSQQALKEAYAGIDAKQILAAARLLSKADKIQLYGRGESLLVAEDFHYKLLRLGVNSALEPLNGFQEVINLQPNKKISTVAVLISQYCNSQQVRYIVDELANNKIPFLIVTMQENIWPYDKFAASVFKLHSSERRTKMGAFASRVAMQYLLDCIYGQLFALHYEQNMESLQNYVHRKAECKYYYK